MALKEVLIASRNFGRGRAQAGDIIAIRDPLGGIGLKEGKDFIWLLIDESELPNGEDLTKEDRSQNKFRYNIPVPQLKQAIPDLDESRLNDPDDFYQPILDCDPRTGLSRQPRPVSDISRRITDRGQ